MTKAILEDIQFLCVSTTESPKVLQLDHVILTDIKLRILMIYYNQSLVCKAD